MQDKAAVEAGVLGMDEQRYKTLSAKMRRLSYQVVVDMMPRDGVAGVDVESQAFKDLCRETLGDECTTSSLQILRREVYRRLRRIGQHGFGDY